MLNNFNRLEAKKRVIIAIIVKIANFFCFFEAENDPPIRDIFLMYPQEN